MPLAATDGRISNPIYVLASAQAIAASATFLSASVCCEESDVATLVYVCDQTHNRDIQVSDDDATWYNLVAGGVIGTSPAATGASAGVSRAVVVPLGGARFVRLSITNTGAVAASLTAKLMVR